MTLSSSWSIYLSNAFHPTTFFVIFSLFLCLRLLILEAFAFAVISASITFLLHRLTPLHPAPSNSAVLLTGAARGLGADACVRLSALGFKVFAGVRKEADGYRLQLKCREYADNVVPVVMDVTKSDEVRSAYHKVQQIMAERGWQLYAVILNAGYGEYGPLEMISVERLRAQLEVNVIAQQLLVQTFVPLLRAHSGYEAAAASGGGAAAASAMQPRLLFVSSIASRISVGGRGAYCAAKAALQMLCDVYRVELRPFNIHVVAITPGELRSAFHGTSKVNYGAILSECTHRALQPPPSTPSSAPVPPPLPLSVINHYDRCYLANAKRRPRTVGSADMFTDAVEVAMRTRFPLPRYDCGDDAAVSSLLLLLPARLRDWLLSRWFMRWTTTAGGEDVTEHKEDDLADKAGDTAIAVKPKDKLMERERKTAPEEETETFVIDDS